MGALGLTALLGLGTACSASSDGADTGDPYQLDVAVLAANEYFSIPWLVGRNQGFFEERGVEIGEIVAGSGGSATLRTQLSGDLPIGEVGYNSVLDAARQGVPVLAVGGGVQNTYGGEFYALRDNDEVDELADIRSWAYTNSGSSIYALSFMLPEVAGLPSDAERVAAGGVGEGVALLEAGEVDVAWLPPTLAAHSKDDFKLVVETQDYIDEFQTSVITTSPQFAESHPDVVEAVLAGYQEAIEWATANPDVAADIYAEHVDVPTDVALEVVRDATEATAWNVGFDARSLEAGTTSAELSGLEGDVDYCTLIDDRFLPQGAVADLPADCS
ncbi:ABC transporter substrate-binding protein [Nocardiopsis aegyptia]